MQPFLKWAGGKRWLVPLLANRLPKYNRYFEPFLGSGALFFALEPNRAIIADSNIDLINCYRCVRDYCFSVIKILEGLRVNEKTYYKIRDELYKYSDDIEKAAFFIYLNKICWNGLFRVNKEGVFNVPIGRIIHESKLFDQDNLIKASYLLKRADIICCDFEESVKNSKPCDLVYFDPPYISTHLKNGFVKYNSKIFHSDDEDRLAKVAYRLAMKKVYVIESNASHPTIKKQYNGLFYKTEFSRHSIIASDSSKRVKIKELLLTNFQI